MTTKSFTRLIRLAFLIIGIALIGCNNITGPRIIVSKAYVNESTEKPMPKGICLYIYRGGGFDQCYFHDSCNKYNVGDTIK